MSIDAPFPWFGGKRRERIWFSPARLGVRGQSQLFLEEQQ